MRQALLLSLVLMGGEAAARQDIEIFKGTDWNKPNPREDTNVLIWTSSSNCIGEAADCTAVGAQAIAEDVREAIDTIGEEVGRRDGGHRLLRIVVSPAPEDGTPGRYGGYFRLTVASVYRTIGR